MLSLQLVSCRRYNHQGNYDLRPAQGPQNAKALELELRYLHDVISSIEIPRTFTPQ